MNQTPDATAALAHELQAVERAALAAAVEIAIAVRSHWWAIGPAMRATRHTALADELSMALAEFAETESAWNTTSQRFLDHLLTVALDGER